MLVHQMKERDLSQTVTRKVATDPDKVLDRSDGTNEGCSEDYSLA